MLNFEGRYYTRNESLFAVHPNHTVDGEEGIRWRGHSINTAQNCVGVLTAWWNERGECVKIVGVVDAVSKYDLMRAVNQQDSLYSDRIVGCPLCEEEFRKRLGIRGDGKVPEYVMVAFFKVWDWMVEKPGYDKEKFREIQKMLEGVERLCELKEENTLR